jgi:signal transduction histidine kinase/CheY-like chemotaxis protein
MSSSDDAFLSQVLRAHDASGELIAARWRAVASGVAVLLVVAARSSNTPAANQVLAVSATVYLVYALAWLRWRSTSSYFAAWMSYVSAAIDLTLCNAIAIACLFNHSGAYEVYRSPLLWLALAAANGLSALRGNPRVSWFCLALTLFYGAVVFAIVQLSGQVTWVTHATYIGAGLNPFEVFLAHLFVVLPAALAARTAQRTSDLAMTTARSERMREDERAQLEWRLKVADRMVTVGTMAAGVAHEVNNPLTYVLHNLDAAGRRAAEKKELSDLRAHIERAQSGAQRVHTIVAALRTFSRIDEGPKHPVDLRGTIDAALTMASSEVKHRARVDIEQQEPIHVLGNEAKLGQVFLNLIVNAAQAIPDPDPSRHRIGIRLMREGERALIEVSDTGVGIPSEHKPRIFDPFFTTKPVGTGTGLGLSICHSIISELSGTIDVRSEPGRGTTFTVSLPLSDQPFMRTSSVQPAAPNHVGRVLVIDDDRLVSEAVELMLSEEHEVVLADSAAAALARIRAGETYDAIVCDLMMPGMSGIELYYELEAERPVLAQRMLFATGGAFTRPAQSFVERMGSRVLPKPFRSDELRGKVHKLVARSISISGSTHVDARDGAANQ